MNYPEKYWKQLNYYYNANKAWIPDKNVEKLTFERIYTVKAADEATAAETVTDEATADETVTDEATTDETAVEDGTADDATTEEEAAEDTAAEE